ncbi:unnamed protein product [Ixodes pacificus]
MVDDESHFTTVSRHSAECTRNSSFSLSATRQAPTRRRNTGRGTQPFCHERNSFRGAQICARRRASQDAFADHSTTPKSFRKSLTAVCVTKD